MKNDGGPAFPCSPTQILGCDYASGMSLRDWFSGQALKGLLAYQGRMGTAYDRSEWAFEQADAMIKERERGV